jgi:hypothetical protein
MASRSTPQSPWLHKFITLVAQKPLVLIRFNRDEWVHLYESRRGVNEFTIARSHSLLDGVRVPIPCIIVAPDPPDPDAADFDPFFSEPLQDADHLHFGLITSRSAVTTLESRIKIKRCVRHQSNLRGRTASTRFTTAPCREPQKAVAIGGIHRAVVAKAQ